MAALDDVIQYAKSAINIIETAKNDVADFPLTYEPLNEVMGDLMSAKVDLEQLIKTVEEIQHPQTVKMIVDRPEIRHG